MLLQYSNAFSKIAMMDNARDLTCMICMLPLLILPLQPLVNFRASKLATGVDDPTERKDLIDIRGNFETLATALTIQCSSHDCRDRLILFSQRTDNPNRQTTAAQNLETDTEQLELKPT